MAEQENQQQSDQQQQTQQPPARPENVPEKFWDPEKGAVRTDEVLKSYGDLEKKLTGGKGLDALTEEIKTGLEAERMKARPEKPDGYKLQLPEGAVPDGVEFQFDDKHPLVGWWRERAHAMGLSQAEFDAGVSEYIKGEVGKLQATSQALVAEFEKLGEQGKARVDFLAGRIESIAGPAAVETLAPFLKTAASVEAMEKIIAAAGGPKFSDIHKAENSAPENLSEEKLKEMKRDPRYWDPKKRDPAYIKQVEDGYQKLFGGQSYIPGAARA